MGINIVNYNGKALVDLSKDTVTPSSMLSGTTAHNAAGDIITGNLIVGEQVNADWNATSGVAEILNKPTAMTGATAETAGTQGFVPAPSAGDQNKVLTGSGEWKHASGVPVGTVVMFTAAEPPAGYLKCDGAAVGRATYPDLFAAIGTTFGAGDGSTTFNLPDSGYKKIDFDTGTTKLTAPDNGYIFVSASTSLGGFYLRNLTKGYLSESIAERNWGLGAFIPCFKGDQIEISPWRSTIISVFFATSPSAPFCESSNGCLCIKAFDAATKPGLIDVTELSNEVDGKADKTQVANLAMPSGSLVPLTPSKGGTYTAPADGYFCFVHGPANNTGQLYIQLHNQTTGFRYQTSAASQSGDWNVGYLPIIRGQTLRLSYGIELSGDSLWFFYAQGSQP